MNSSKPVHNVIFDLGAVLIEWRPDQVLRRHCDDESERAQLMQAIFRHPDWLEMDRGTLSERDAIPRFAERGGVPAARIEVLLSAVKDSMVAIRDSEALLGEAKERGLNLYCLSNMGIETYEHLRARHEFFRLFDGIVISAHEKLIKPDPEIFRLILDRYALDPAVTLFIDDSEANVSAAEEHGVRTVRFVPTRECIEVIRSHWSASSD